MPNFAAFDGQVWKIAFFEIDKTERPKDLSFRSEKRGTSVKAHLESIRI